MKVLIIEDEFRNYNRLHKMLLHAHPDLTIEGPLESVADARVWFSAHRGTLAPDIIFSDIRLSDGLCFDALDLMDEASSLVFTTAYDEYALQAFHYNGLAYLLKPIEEDELRQTLDRITKLRKSGTSNIESGMTELLRQMQRDSFRYRERFLVPYKDGFEIVNVDDIDFICTEFKDTRVYAKGRIFSLSMSLDEVERQLNLRAFFRVNRQYIVNLTAVAGLKTLFGAKLRVLIHGHDRTEVVCSREKAPLLKEWLNS